MLTFRPRNWTDAAPLYVWRHDPETVKWSINPPPTWDEHLNFMNHAISVDTVKRWMGCMEEVSIVAVGLWENGNVDVMVNPDMRGLGYGFDAIKYLKLYHNKNLTALIKADNEASIQLFTKCGFKKVGIEIGDLMLWRWTP